MTVGMVAGDEESYEEFAELFDPVIDSRHNGYKKVNFLELSAPACNHHLGAEIHQSLPLGRLPF